MKCDFNNFDRTKPGAIATALFASKPLKDLDAREDLLIAVGLLLGSSDNTAHPQQRHLKLRRVHSKAVTSYRVEDSRPGYGTVFLADVPLDRKQPILFQTTKNGQWQQQVLEWAAEYRATLP